MRNMNIFLRLFYSFGLMVLLALIIGILGFIQVNTLWEYTEGLYNHPLQVSNAVRDIQIQITGIHRNMKDVVLSESNEELYEIQKLIVNQEASIFEDFGVIEERFLGDLDDIKKAYELFLAWEPIRNEVIELYLAGDPVAAAAITKGKGADHVNRMTEAMNKMVIYAESKAQEFYREAEAERQIMINQLIVSMLLVTILAVLIAFLLLRKTIRPIQDMRDHLKDVIRINEEQASSILDLEKQRFNKVIKTSPFPAMVHDEEGEILIFSDRLNALSATPVGNVTSLEIWLEHCFSSLPDEELQVIRDHFFSNDQSLRDLIDIELVDPQGKRRSWNFTTAVLGKDSQGKEQFLTIASDNTLQKENSLRISAERERLAVTMRSIGDGVITTDIDGNVQLINRIAEELTGWTQAEAFGRPLEQVFNIIHESTREKHINPVMKVLETGMIIELENHTVLISKDGSERVIADSGAPIRDMNSQIIGVVLVFRDETEKRLLLRQSQKNEKLESLGVLAGGLAHDFNNILSGLFGNIELALEMNKDPIIDEFLIKSIKAFDRAKGITSQLLTFSRGGAPLRRVEDIGKLIEKNASFVVSGTNVVVETHIEPDIWNCNVDRNQLGQVIDNLVINAQQAMPTGGVVTINASNTVVTNSSINEEDKDPGEYVAIEVLDTGAGMKPEVLQKIYDPFFTTKEAGNGLGLATCFSIIKRHEGYIEVSSQVGKGSVFTIYLPRATSQSGIIQNKKDLVHQGSGYILIMDDEKAILHVLKTMLVSMGYQVVLAKNSEEAISRTQELISDNQPLRMAILDLTIPGEAGGSKVRKSITNLFPSCITIASSGYSNNPIMANPKESGFSGSLNKPFRLKELNSLMNRYLGAEGRS